MLEQGEHIVVGDLLNEHGQLVSGCRTALFEPDGKIRQTVGILPACAVINSTSGRIPVRILNVRGNQSYRR